MGRSAESDLLGISRIPVRLAWGDDLEKNGIGYVPVGGVWRQGETCKDQYLLRNIVGRQFSRYLNFENIVRMRKSADSNCKGHVTLRPLRRSANATKRGS